MAAKRRRQQSRARPKPRPKKQTAKGSGGGQPPRTAAVAAASPVARPARPTREERIERQRRSRRRRELRTRTILIVVAVAIVGTIAFVVVNNRRQNARLISALEAGSCTFDRDADSGRDHLVGAVSYRVDPPAGGDHLASPSPAGTYHGANVPADGNLVHSLEHGFVILWHDSGLSDDERGKLVDATRRYERDVLIVERPSLTVPVAASAWHKRLLCTELDADSVAPFVREFRNEGPERVPHPWPDRSRGLRSVREWRAPDAGFSVGVGWPE